jgi:hypothetical protein
MRARASSRTPRAVQVRLTGAVFLLEMSVDDFFTPQTRMTRWSIEAAARINSRGLDTKRIVANGGALWALIYAFPISDNQALL